MTTTSTDNLHTQLRDRLLTFFSRLSTATYTDLNGIVQTAAINVLRNAHYVAGVLQPPLIEPAATNPLLWSSDFSNAVWTKTNATVNTGIADPAGGTSACTVTATAGFGGVRQTLSAGTSIVRTNSLWIRRRTGTGTVNLWSPDGGTPNAITTLTAQWQRFSITNAGASTLRSIQTENTTNGDAIDVWGAQQEDGSVATSTIATTSMPATRAADVRPLNIRLGGVATNDGRLYKSQAPDTVLYPFGVMRLINQLTRGEYNGERENVDLEIMLFGRPRSQGLTIEDAADVCDQAMLRYKDASSGLMFSRGRQRDTMPQPVDPADREVVQIRLVYSLIVWPTYLTQYASP